MFDTAKFLEFHFTDADGVIGLVGKHWPLVPRRETVRKWFERSSIASEWFPVLLIALERETGAPVSLSQSIIVEEQHDIFA